MAAAEEAAREDPSEYHARGGAVRRRRQEAAGKTQPSEYHAMMDRGRPGTHRGKQPLPSPASEAVVGQNTPEAEGSLPRPRRRRRCAVNVAVPGRAAG